MRIAFILMILILAVTVQAAEQPVRFTSLDDSVKLNIYSTATGGQGSVSFKEDFMSIDFHGFTLSTSVSLRQTSRVESQITYTGTYTTINSRTRAVEKGTGIYHADFVHVENEGYYLTLSGPHLNKVVRVRNLIK